MSTRKTGKARARARGPQHGSVSTPWNIRPRWRMMRGGIIALGPGKADLLEAIATTGSISSAAKALRMSYRRAWVLVATMNSSFRKRVVATSAERRAGAMLTAEGRRILALYRRIEARSIAAARPHMLSLMKLLRSADH